jgi:serine/threonine-protein kinase HipA
MELLYDRAWVESPQARPLSLSLPINLDGAPIRGERVGFYFDNLLPDSDAIRARAQSRFKTRSREAFDLLEAMGRDCVGAVQLLPEDATPEDVFAIDAEPLDDGQIERRLVDSLTSGGASPALESDDDFRISIAGAQEKTAFTLHAGRWCRPHGATPTTHIFKLPLGMVGHRQLDLRSSLENEWLCTKILAQYGLPVAKSELLSFGAAKTLVVERFDRQLDATKRYWLRLPQEDFCQATATPPSSKYESDGGPGLTEIAAVLRGSERRDQDIATLLEAALLFLMLAAIDGHAKNFSIHLLPSSRYHLTPLYDVLSAWPIVGTGHDQLHPNKLKLAMALRGKSKHYHLRQIQRRHFNATARACGFGTDMEPIIGKVIEATPGVIDVVGSELPAGFPTNLFDAITGRLKAAAAALGAMPAEAAGRP